MSERCDQIPCGGPISTTEGWQPPDPTEGAPPVVTHVAVPAAILGERSGLKFPLWHKQADSQMVPCGPADPAGPPEVGATPTADAQPEHLYVASGDYYLYRKWVESRVGRLLADAKLGERRFELAYQVVVQLIQEMLESWPGAELVARVQRVAGQIAAAASDDALLRQWSCVRAGEYATASHSVNVCLLSLLVARSLGWAEDGQSELAAAMLLHDAGKSGVPDAIWEREGRLQPADWDLVRQHPVRGGAWLLHATGLDARIIKVATRHHEQPNGQGYPFGLASNDLDRWTRLCAVVDTFDRLTSGRSFRRGLEPRQAMTAIRAALIGRFDREVVDQLHRLVLDDVVGQPAKGPAESGANAGAAAGNRGPRELLPLEGYLPLPPLKPEIRTDDRPARPSASGQPNRRRFPRHAYRMPCRVRYVRPGAAAQDHISFWVTAVDLSRGGIQFVHEGPVPLSEVISLFLPDGNQGRHVNARVVRCQREAGGAYSIAARFDFQR